MNNTHAPGRLAVLAVLLAGFAIPAIAAPSDIVISQVYGGGGNSGAMFKNDFVELFNRGASPVSVAGMSVQYTSSTGPGTTGTGSWLTTPLPATTLQPGQFMLVQLAAGTGTQPLLPTPDATGGTNMSGTSGKILLSSGATALTGFSPAAGVLDLVGWGSANGFEGAPAAATTNATAIKRIDACVDSDNNSGDFSVQTPTPRNMGSPLTPCAGAPVIPIIASCPASLALQYGSAGAAALSASDEDGTVNGAAITGGAVDGILLTGFTPASGNGASASVSLAVAAGVPVGSYPVVVNFTNNDGQSKSCTVDVSVQGLADVTRTIPQIQGAGATSPYANTVQTTEGVVTHKIGTGFFMQDANGDNDPTTSDGIFVYMGSTAVGAAVGDLVRVTGTVTEYTPTGANRSYTELKDTTAIFVQSSGHSVTPANINALDALDRVEGMLVNFTGALTVNQTSYLGTRGELSLSIGRRESPTNRYRPGTPEALAMAAANASNLIVLDDNIFTTPTVIPYIGEGGTVRAGDTVTGLTGVVDFGAIGGGAAFKLQPTVAPVFSRTNARTAAPEVAPGNVRVASANVLNFFTTFTNGQDAWGNTGQGCTLGTTTSASNCRGADNLAEFVRQRDKIVHSLKAIDADVVGLMEIQNNDDIAVTYLVDALNQAIGGDPVYAVVPRPPHTGTDAVRVAMIYKPAKLSLSGVAMSDGDVLNNRAPMAQTFTIPSGGRFSVVVNHLRAKSCSGATGANADQGDGQSCFNATRVEQATRLAEVFIPQVVAAAGDPDVLVIGDMNAQGFEDPIHALTTRGLVNELERHVRPHGMPYSYVFGGTSAYLDHALASVSLDSQVVGATEWHNNADEPEVIDYNTDGKSQDLYASNAYRASDHDPVVISLDLPPVHAADVTSSFSSALTGPTYNRATQKFTGKYSFTNKTGSTIAGPLHVIFSGLPAGVTLDNASGQFGGAPYITADAASVAPGATVTVSMTFTNPAKAAISFSNAIYAGVF